MTIIILRAKKSKQTHLLFYKWKEVKIIKEFTHVLLLDSDDLDFPVSNLTDNIETLLKGSSVAIKFHREDAYIGMITYAANRSKTGLYYGNIELVDEFDNFEKIKIVETKLILSEKEFNTITGFVTYIEKE